MLSSRLQSFFLIVGSLVAVGTLMPFILSGTRSAEPFALEVEVSSDTFANVQVYFDVGRGLNENDSVRIAVVAAEAFTRLRLPLPGGSYQSLRFDPLDRPGQIRIRDLRIVGDGGRLVREFTPEQLMPTHQIASFDVRDDTIDITVEPPANDPNIAIELGRPLVLSETSGYIQPALQFVVLPAGVMAALLLLVRWVGGPRATWLARIRTFASARPRQSVLLVGLAVVMISGYPVIFLGKSHVSPNFSDGTYLLYDRFPTLPGGTDVVTEDAKGADVGAIFWQFIPFAFLQHQALLEEGELPLWNRFNSGGTVLFAQGQSMFGDPLHLLVVLVGGQAWAWDAKYLLAKWGLCVALGLIVLRGTQHLPSAMFATISAAFLGFFIYRVNHSAYFSFCYAPWILYAWLGIVQARTWRKVAAWCGALILANAWVMHSGTIKEAYMLLLGLNLTGACLLAFAGRPVRERLLVFASAGWAGAIFVLLTAPSWLTFKDALAQAYTSYNSASAYQISPSLLLGLFDEVFYRPIQRGVRVSNPSANFLVLTGVLYFLATFRIAATSRVGRAVAWSALIPLALAFGIVPPQWIVRVPFLANVAHIDNSFSCVLIVLLVVLAGFGWQAMFKRLGTSEGGHDLVRAGWAYAILVGLWVAFTHTVHRPIFGTTEVISLLQWGQKVPVTGFVWVSLLSLTLALAMFLLGLRGMLKRGRLDPVSGAVFALAVGVMLWRHGLHARAVGPADYVFTPAIRMDFQAESPAIAAIQDAQSEPGRVVGFRGNLFPGWSAAYGLEGINGPDALVNPFYRELQEALGLERIWDWRIYTTSENLVSTKAALDFLNVRHYVDMPGDPGRFTPPLDLALRADLDVFRSAEAWPRAFFTSGIFRYESPRQLGERVRAQPGQPFAGMASADVEGSVLAALPETGTAAIVAATDYRLTTNTTAFTIDAPGPGLAVLHEAWLRGDFQARIDGERVPYFRVNHAFKGVQVTSAGRHRIEFTYWPRRFNLALTLSTVGFGLAVLTGIVCVRGPRAARSFANSAP